MLHFLLFLNNVTNKFETTKREGKEDQGGSKIRVIFLFFFEKKMMKENIFDIKSKKYPNQIKFIQ